jgi:A/G-specific adenine glycosylase
MIDRTKLQDFHTALHTWFSLNGRRGLPWRDNPTPYAVLVSEFMLQQTTVATVIPRFNNWIARFPDIHSVANASEAMVLKEWEGLGYYSRARNLHRAAKAIATEHGGTIPFDPATLRNLPGIGRYTASAIAAFAFEKCLPVLDANIIRLIARLENFTKPVSTSQGMASIEGFASALLPEIGGRIHTSALMDLGSMICRAGTPDCLSCPLRSFCKADNPALLPVTPPRKKTTEVVEVRFLAVTPTTVYLLQSPGPRWKGLWILPPCTNPGEQPIVTITHAITRFKVRLELNLAAPDPHLTAFPLDNLPAMPSPHRKALAMALEKIHIGSTGHF